MGVRERKVEKYFDDEVKKIGGITRKWVCPGVDGVPDRIVIYKGTTCFVEVKTIDGVLSSEQMREHERLREAGAYVCTIYGDDGIDEFIGDLDVV